MCKEKFTKSAIMAEDFNISQSWIDQTIKSVITEKFWILQDIYTIVPSTTEDYTLFPDTFRRFVKIDYVLNHKARLNRFQGWE